jgi:2-isopropylmalate synthase
MKPQRCDEPNKSGDAAVGRVLVFDTTLREGERAPGFSLDRKAKLRMAQMLETLGVDVLEAGFPQASPDDFAAVAAVAGVLRTTVVCALARCVPGDIDSAGKALKKARRSRIHLFLSTSPLHRGHKPGMDKMQVLETAVAAVEHACQRADEVEFSAEDATRTEWDFLTEVFSAVAKAGATTLNVPDTVGYTTPAEMAGLFRYLRSHVPASDKLVFSGHCHDDLGMAVANSLAAVSGGARQVECTVNGIGERAGNAALEEVVMALKVRGGYFGVDTRVDTHKLYPASRMLAELTGHAVPRNKAVVGANAFVHKSGIHRHGMLKHRDIHEIMCPEDVGFGGTPLMLGKHSGRAALRARLAALGHTPDKMALDDIFARFKVLADRKSEIHDGDLNALCDHAAGSRTPKARATRVPV